MLEEKAEEIIYKVCSRCGVSKRLNEFHKSKTGKFGRKSACKQCRAVYNKLRFQENHERILLKQKQYRHDNRKVISHRDSLYRSTEKGRLVHIYARQRYNKTHAEQIYERMHTQDYRKHKCKYDRQYNQKNRAKITKRARLWRQSDKGRVASIRHSHNKRARKKAAGKTDLTPEMLD